MQHVFWAAVPAANTAASCQQRLTPPLFAAVITEKIRQLGKMGSCSAAPVEGVVLLSKLHQRAAAATTAVQSMVPSMPAAQLFEVNAETQCGDTVVIVGSVEELGNWEVHRGQRMETDETLPSMACMAQGLPT